jgi:hypothetical protein
MYRPFSTSSSSSDAVHPSAKRAKQGPELFPRAHSVLSRFPTLSRERLRDHKAFIKSNDVPITGLERFRVAEGEHMMLIGSSSMNPIAVACELAANNKMQIIPQVVMIDDGENAAKIWKAMRKLFKDSTASQFSSRLQAFLEANLAMLTANSDALHIAAKVKMNSDYIEEVIQKYTYGFVKEVVLQTVYLKQEWQDESTFDGIRNFIDASGCKNIFVYPSNIVILNDEYISKRICQNISRLNPRLTIHTNLNIDLMHPTEFLLLEGEAENSPEEAMKRIIASIRFESSTKTYIVGMAIYAVTSQNYRLVMEKEMHSALNKMIGDNQYNLSQYKTPFLLDIIFRMAGITTRIDRHMQNLADYYPETVFQVTTPMEEMEQALEILNIKFPQLKADFAMPGQQVADPDWPTRITLDINGLISILNLIPPYLRENPDLLRHYENLNSVQKKISTLFENLHMSTSSSDCFEETLCLMVQEKLKKEGIEVEELETTTSMFDNATDRLNRTNIYVSTPVHAAQHIVNYFNKIKPDSADMEEKQVWVTGKNAHLTKISVEDSAILSDEFHEDLSYALSNLVPKEKIDDYWRQAGYVRPFDRYIGVSLSYSRMSRY